MLYIATDNVKDCWHNLNTIKKNSAITVSNQHFISTIYSPPTP